MIELALSFGSPQSFHKFVLVLPKFYFLERPACPDYRERFCGVRSQPVELLLIFPDFRSY